MSNYGTTYNISQTGNLYTLDAAGAKTGLAQYNSTRGTTVNAPINYRFLKLFRGLDNEFFFFVKNQDRKPIMLQGVTVNASLVSRETKSKIVSKKCQVTDYELGSISLTITSGEIAALTQGLFDLVFTYTNERGLTLPLFCDQNMRPNYTVEVSEEAADIPLTTAATSNFMMLNGYYTSDLLPSSGYFNKLNSLVTIAVYATNYTGLFYIQGAIAENPTEDDWFNITLGTHTDEFYPYTNFSGIDPWTFRTNIKYVRARFTADQGTVDKLVIRV
jgi:hypothetical protein